MALSDLRRRLLRSRGRRLAASAGRLDLCAECGADSACPVPWSEPGPADWGLLPGCGECGTSREVTASNAAVARYDSQLDEGMTAINRAADRLSREALAAEA